MAIVVFERFVDYDFVGFEIQVGVQPLDIALVGYSGGSGKAVGVLPCIDCRSFFCYF